MGIDEHQYIGAAWGLIFVATCVVSARYVLRVMERDWSFWLADTFLTLGLFTLMAFISGYTYWYITVAEEYDATDDEVYNKWTFATYYFFDCGTYLPRFSQLAFYHRIIPITQPRLQLFFNFTVIYATCCFVASVVMETFWCGPDVSLHWSAEGAYCREVWVLPEIYYLWPLCITSEILILIVPLPLLRSIIKMNKKEKVGLSTIFLLGIITIFVSIVRFIYFLQAVFTWDILLVATAEFATGIIVVGLQALRPLIIRKHPRKGQKLYSRETFSSNTTTLWDMEHPYPRPESIR